MQRRLARAAGEEDDFVLRVVEVDRLLRPRAAPGMRRLVGRVRHPLQPGGPCRHQPVQSGDGARRHDHPRAVARGLAELACELVVGQSAHRGDDQIRARCDHPGAERAQSLVSRRLDHDVGLDRDHLFRVVPHGYAGIGLGPGAHQSAVQPVDLAQFAQPGDDRLSDGAVADQREPHAFHAASMASPRWQMPLK